MPWRSRSLTNLAESVSFKKNSILHSVSSLKKSRDNVSVDFLNAEKSSSTPELIVKRDKREGNITVTIVIVEAKGLPQAPDDDSSTQGIFCSFRLGSQTYRSKTVPKSRRPQWRERFKLYLCKDAQLKMQLFHKGKQKSFMGSCVLDLSRHEQERTHDIWLTLDGGYGSVHLSVTMCNTRHADVEVLAKPNVEELRREYAYYNLHPDNMELVGQLFVKVIGARGLSGKPSAYCSLELDNEKVQTHTIANSSDPMWNKTYAFNVYDVTSVLELKVMDTSLQALLGGFLGRLSIPLLRIADGIPRWYVLKDHNRRKSAKGNNPRIKLEMSIFWNPVYASLKLFQPKAVKYIEKPPKFDLGLVYKNLKFIRDTLNFLKEINEAYKRVFEWDDREFSSLCLVFWIGICCIFSAWTIPLCLLPPFIICWYFEQKRQDDQPEPKEVASTSDPHRDSIASKIQGLPEITFDIKDGIDYSVSVAERLLNLVTFKVPFLSCITIIILISSSVILYYVPFRYLMIALALYKFGRKQLNPNRKLNNDLLDFISRIPDDKMLKDWKELPVPEPNAPANHGSNPTPSTSSRAFS